MRQVAEYGGYVNLVLFTVVALVAVRQWRLGRGRAGVWAALTFGSLAFVADIGPLLDSDPETRAEDLLLRVLIATLVLFPYFLYRFTTAFERPTRQLERLLGVMTLVVLVWTFLVPDIPAEGEPRSPAFVSYLIGFLVHWTVLSIVVAVRLWRAARRAPAVARRRMDMLALGAAAITAALLISATGPGEHSALQAVVNLLGTLSAGAFLLGIAPPPLLRLAWRRPEQERLQTAIAQLMRAPSEENVLEEVLPPMERIVGARAIALLDHEGRPIGTHRASDEMLTRVRDGDLEDVVELDAPFGKLVVWTSPYSPYFGGEEMRLLATLGALTGLALDRSRLYAQERRARVALERADELKSNFIALAAHELRTPVTSINGVIETLHTRGDELDADQRRNLQQAAHAQGKRLAVLVEQLLDLSRLDAEAIVVEPRPLPVRARVEVLVREAAGERADQVEIDVPPGLEAQVDPAVFERIVSNLVTNALRYGAPPVTVRAEQRDRHFRLSVEDRGAGVPPEFVPELFERFTRSAATMQTVGTGLGLAIARSYAHAHRGELVYEPAEPHGSRFELVLPQEPNNNDVQAHGARRLVRARGLEPPRGLRPNGT